MSNRKMPKLGKILPNDGSINVRHADPIVRVQPMNYPMAHPCHLGNGVFVPGMMLWDFYFASAMQTLSSAALDEFINNTSPGGADYLAGKARQLADAMTRERDAKFEALQQTENDQS